MSIETPTPKCRLFLNWPVLGTWRQVFICLGLPAPPPVHTVWIHTPVRVLIQPGGWGGGAGGWTSEKVRGATVHKRGRKYQHDWLYLQSTPVKTTFRVWCLYRYGVHDVHLGVYLLGMSRAGQCSGLWNWRAAWWRTPGTRSRPGASRIVSQTGTTVILLTSVGDPDPQDLHVFGPPGSWSIGQKYASGSASIPFSEIMLAK